MLKIVSSPFDFLILKVKVQSEACIFLSELIVGARATAFAWSAAISMPPVPVVAMLAA